MAFDLMNPKGEQSMEIPKRASVVLLDPEPVARCGLAHLLSSHEALEVVAEADSVPVARSLCEKWQPAVLVIDVAVGDGLHFVKELPTWSARTRAAFGPTAQIG